MHQRIRISDIAEELGLSTATVSNVLHGKPGKASEETVRRVQELLEKRQYIPSMAGILLAQNSSRIIGIFVNDHEKYEGHTLQDAFIAASLDCLSAEIEARGLFMMVKRAREADEIIKFASMWNMDGLVVIGFCAQDYSYLRRHMRIPFVVYDGLCDKPERIVNLTLDNFDGGRQVGEYFRTGGHTRALCVADNYEGVDRERIEGFIAGFGGGTELMRVPITAAARRAHYLAARERFGGVTAIFAVSDYYAAELISFLTGEGLSVPGDISVAGFDDNPLCLLTHPTLTSVRQDGAQRARLAMDKLAALSCGDEAGGTVKLPVRLIVRDSTRQVR